MSTRERAKACERALANANKVCSRQRRNMKAYVAIILNTKEALTANDSLRALALVSGNIKFPPGILNEDLACECEHISRTKKWVCNDCGREVIT